jgi:DNA phosphorothioation-associated putative methyltransferase
MRRDSLSRPIRLALLHEIVSSGVTVFDYGCGRGDDIDRLKRRGVDAKGWDPHHKPNVKQRPANVVNLGYVVNVVEDPIERQQTLRQAWNLARNVLVVSARLDHELDDAHVAVFGDGWLTRQGTFQKFFTHEELGDWIGAVLGEQPIAAGPGIYYVFRHADERERYLVSRFRRPVALPRSRPSDDDYKNHKQILDPLIEFVGERGRLPAVDELDETAALEDAFGSLRRAFRVVLWVTDREAWDLVRRERSVGLLVHLALARFHGRSRWSELPDELQRDVRAFYRSYKKSCEEADRLLLATGNKDAILLACRASGVGKLTPTAVYIHKSSLNDLPALLRVYEGCARALVGTVEGANVIKLFRVEPKVSYLAYPEFDKIAHPRLEEVFLCDLGAQKVRWRDYRSSRNPPILHRKEMLVSAQYPGRSKFARLTKAEEAAGLFETPETIGLRVGWDEALRAKGVHLQGHRLCRGALGDGERSEPPPVGEVSER